MFVPSTKHVIHYRIAPKSGSVRLTFWEMAPRRPKQLYPYLYIANYLLDSIEEAHQLLRDHLYVNGVASVESLKFSQQGQINVTPYPALSTSFNIGLEAVAEQAC
ncbi:MAG: hypothetical protein F6J97_03850 [Leptolyngbya sp. SIO4C1]|nr:hypothetical protein [Leptolyngbya sp. SIO4C1]